ncbi:hypothetical protein TPHA_0C00370 [Tetrapisispora phaffii CBS 4417]|uniref:Palmitoyltransferase n=1 Tax=Tetrapisispora phaffii (strain ATCC 24235 / CBS 4417 / NBRC 1672 / NRRL Y-8282 / UCD 70-5) TaxID=1071381 RepID=G8BR18_TETPH|nr:hypothetical protein TPHA_0C00370 [Tetrapisispora phaffii CBS 4417]CCE62194.1 hypothetical protein TPHA_0C00370 [Tetrapisispora phaffii CBS 4417]
MNEANDVDSIKGDVSDQTELDDISVSSVKPLVSQDDEIVSQISDSTEHMTEREQDIQGQIPEDSIIGSYRVACQSNDIDTVKELIESGAVDIHHDYNDNDHITGLHWACVNNRFAISQYLIKKGADVNKKAGKLNATPLHWAASYGYVHIVDCLLKHGADPTIVDDQGFNLLHLSINSSNIMLVIYVLYFVVDKGIIEVDCQDPNGRTPLLWAAYQGDSLSIKMLLSFGASTKIVDNTGFTPLHWGVVKGQPHVLKYLIKDGADFFAKTNDGKDCFAIAEEMNTTYFLREALDHCGFTKDGFLKKKLFKKSFHAKILTFFLPWILLGSITFLFSHIHPLFALIITLILLIITNQLLQRVLIPCYTVTTNNTISLIQTPLFAGLFAGSVFWLSSVWITKVFLTTVTLKPFRNMSLLITISIICILFGKLITSDPGNIYEEKDHGLVREMVEELMKLGKYDTSNFCIETLTRKPLRSRYSYMNNALVSRFDHYCPWVYNDVGLKNHKTFLFFILSMETGIGLFTSLCLEYFDQLEDLYDDDKLKCLLLGDDELCAGFTHDRFSFLIMAWSAFQFLWVSLLIFVQVFQVTKGVTSYEFNKIVKHGKQVTNSLPFKETFNTTPDISVPNNGSSSGGDDNGTTDGEIGDTTSSTIRHRRSNKIWGVCAAVLGIDQWIMVLKETIGLLPKRQTSESDRPFIVTNYGIKNNCIDFFLTSDTSAPIWQRFIYEPTSLKALLNNNEVDYATLYSLPSIGTTDDVSTIV